MLSLALLASCAGEPDTAGTAEKFTVGYGERDIEFDIGEDIIYVAGYRGGNRAQGVLDVPKVKAVWLEAGESTLLISVDCVGLASGTVKEIRKALSWLVRESGCGSEEASASNSAGLMFRAAEAVKAASKPSQEE